MDAITTNIASTFKPEQRHAMKQAAQDFEAVFLSEMFSHMFAGLETDPMFGGGNAEKIYRSMMVSEYGKMVAQKGGVGIADHVMQEMINIQQKVNGA